MNLKKIIDIYNIIKDRLPNTYPRPKLAFFEDEDCMLDNNNELKKKEGESFFAILNPETLTINLPLSITFKHTNRRGITHNNKILLNKMTSEDIAEVLLHELGHVYAGERYGYNSKKYIDEDYCDKFANRWVKILKQEKLL